MDDQHSQGLSHLEMVNQIQMKNTKPHVLAISAFDKIVNALRGHEQRGDRHLSKMIGAKVSVHHRSTTWQKVVILRAGKVVHMEAVLRALEREGLIEVLER
mgnify:CR=1 FL=1